MVKASKIIIGVLIGILALFILMLPWLFLFVAFGSIPVFWDFPYEWTKSFIYDEILAILIYLLPVAAIFIGISVARNSKRLIIISSCCAIAVELLCFLFFILGQNLNTLL